MSESAVSLSTVGQISIPVSSVEAAVSFYRDKLGITFLFKAPPGMAFFQCGSLMLLLGEPEGGDFRPSSSIVYFSVPDIEAAHEGLVAQGVEFVETPQLVHRAADFELWMGFFRDPDGNPLAIMSRKKI